ncbi:OB-fold protein [Dinghuibacter silviterrae]|uniref:Putative nucleic acid binding protein n=1 Tax=Dinghuibacter silviterrae TaxID=1539049 RepID=A0A4R8DGK4_9BACT|nr:hypothetical protein [Dinghuibacter silviterrae]TDW96625.1 putative nucleic acid binding protein [Dinghuibacter silviterrae]
MRKKNIFIAGAILLAILILCGGYGWYLYNKPHQGVDGVRTTAKLEADTLFNAFQADENRANGLYLGKVLEVRGKMAAQTPGSLQLTCGNAMGGINCSLAPGQTLPKADTSAFITIKGRCTGYLMDVNLVDCIIEQIEQ